MLKETVVYTDYNDVQQSETIYFNLTKTELMDLLELQPRIDAWATKTSGDPRDLTTNEITELLEIIKILIEKSYGVRSDDGKHFRKSPELFRDFKESAVYDSFVFSLFENIPRGVNFMIGIMPKGLVDEKARAELQQELGIEQEVPMPEQVAEIKATDKEVPAWIREDREPTQAEMAKMDRDEMLLAFQRKTQKQAQQ